MQPNKVKTLFGNNINDGVNYRAAIANADTLPSAANVWLSQQGQDSVDSGAFTVGLRYLAVVIEILDFGNRYALAEQLKQWTKRGTRGELVTTFKDDGKDYQVSCAAVDLRYDPNFPQYYVAQLESGNTAWRAVVADTDTLIVSGTGGYKDITVLGGDETALIATLTATANPVIGYLYQNIYRLVDVPGINYGARPWCMTVNTQALVTAGKMQSDCDDLRVIVNGKEVKRWIANPNTTATNIWINLPLGPGKSLTLDTAIGSSGDISVIQLTKTPTNKAALAGLAATGVVYDGTEWIGYIGKDVAKYQLKTPARGLFGTTRQAHASGSTLKYIQNVVIIKYGNSTATSPALTDATYDVSKPLFDLGASDNTKWVYTATTKFYDPTRPAAPGTFTPVLDVAGDVSEYYSIKENAETGDAAIGAKLSVYTKMGLVQAEKGRVGFQMRCAGKFYRMTLTGRKYRSTVRWPAFSGLQRSVDGKKWFNVWIDATPTVAGAWQALAAHSAVAISTDSQYIFFGLEGTINVLNNAYSMLEGLTGTVEFLTSNLPTGAFLGETVNFGMDFYFENETTSDRVYLDYPLLLNKPLVLDSENSEITFDRHAVHDAMRLDDEGRSVWIRLLKGVNRIRIAGSDCGTMSGAFSWYRRRL